MLLLFLMFSKFIFYLTRPTYDWIILNVFIYIYIVHVCRGTFLPSTNSLPTLPRVCGKSKIAIESDRMIYFHCGNRVSRRNRVFLIDNSQNAQNLSRIADDWSLVYTFTYVHTLDVGFVRVLLPNVLKVCRILYNSTYNW